MTPQEALEKILSVLKSKKKSGDKTAQEYLREDISNIGVDSFPENLLALAEGVEKYAKLLPDDFEKKALFYKLVVKLEDDEQYGSKPDNIRALNSVIEKLAGYFNKDFLFERRTSVMELVMFAARDSNPKRIIKVAEVFEDIVKFCDPEKATKTLPMLYVLLNAKPGLSIEPDFTDQDDFKKTISLDRITKLGQGLRYIEPTPKLVKQLKGFNLKTLELIAEVGSQQRRKPEAVQALSEQKSK